MMSPYNEADLMSNGERNEVLIALENLRSACGETNWVLLQLVFFGMFVLSVIGLSHLLS